ncbi:FkbM family methyltransferase [Agrobacterium vitis]|nr:FkbM family methyltransferase [Agrobacterium vitis]MBE1436946.1 FkbM family methyltransferase [Agrobacterium vitis]
MNFNSTIKKIKYYYNKITGKLNKKNSENVENEYYIDLISNKIAKKLNKLNYIEYKIEKIDRNIEFIKNSMSSYLGGGVSLTYLADETPIFVNSNDYGGPTNIINGGKYETENLEVLQSFVKPDSIILDVGANLGYFSLKFARQIRSRGKIYSFEPHPFVSELLSRSVFMNGFNKAIAVHRFGLSDRAGNASFAYPPGHVGGGGIVEHSAEAIQLEIKVTDEVFPPDFTANIVKIDVEGHEYNVLRGMKGIIERSSDIVILFEKLSINAGNEDRLVSFFKEVGMDLYAVMPDSTLNLIEPETLSDFGGYVLANKKANKIDLVRSKFEIYPEQLNILGSSTTSQETDTTHISKTDSGIIFHGPYWYLGRGLWRMTLIGKIEGIIIIRIAERFGHTVHSFPLTGENAVADFVVDHDLIYFEIIAENAAGNTKIELRNIVMQRLAV